VRVAKPNKEDTMPVETKVISDSDEVLAPINMPDHLVCGKRVSVTITRGIWHDPQLSSQVKMAMVGKLVSTIFTAGQLAGHQHCFELIPRLTRLAYVSEIVELLEKSGEASAAQALKQAMPNQLDLLMIDPEAYVNEGERDPAEEWYPTPAKECF